MAKNWKRCNLHGKWFDGNRYARCYTCNRTPRNACIECGYSDCNGLCLDIALERARGVRDD